MSASRHESASLVRRIAIAIMSFVGFGPDELLPASHDANFDVDMPAPSPSLRLVSASPAPGAPVPHKWQRHPQLRAYTPPITPDVREARRVAVRGLYAVREGAHDVALELFTTAARCRDIDLTALPNFWDLTRGQMMVAVSAYETVERYRDAAALDAQITTIFRPTLLVGQDPPPTHTPLSNIRASGD